MTARRALPLLAVTAVVALGGCDYGTAAKLTTEQEQARIAFIEDRPDWSDRELAKLCPGLYPKDFLTDEDEYPVPRDEDDRTPKKITAQDRADADAAGCDIRP